MFVRTILAAAVVLSTVFAAAGASAETRLDRIAKAGTLRVCIWPDYFAITYRNPRSGELEGIDIDLARDFAADLGVSVTFVDSSFSKLIDNLKSDACDIAMHAVGIRPDRQAVLDFSEPHLISGIYAVTPRSHPTVKTWTDIDKTGHVVVVQRGTYMEPVMRAALKAATLNVVDDFKAREQEVESGRADVFMTDYPYGRRMAALTPWARLLEPAEPFAPTPYAYAIDKGQPEWLERVNAFVRTVKADGRLVRAAEKNGLLPIVAR